MTRHCAVSYMEPEGSFGYIFGADTLASIDMVIQPLAGGEAKTVVLQYNDRKTFRGETFVGAIHGMGDPIPMDLDDKILPHLQNDFLREFEGIFDGIEDGASYVKVPILKPDENRLTIVTSRDGKAELFTVESSGGNVAVAHKLDEVPLSGGHDGATHLWYLPELRVPPEGSVHGYIRKTAPRWVKSGRAQGLAVKWLIDPPQSADGYRPTGITLYRVSGAGIQEIEFVDE